MIINKKAQVEIYEQTEDEAHSIYIKLEGRKQIHSTKPLENSLVYLDLDKDGNITGIEIVI